MNDVDAIFKAFGGTGAVAAILGVKHSAASEMRRRGSIPVKYWPKLTEHGREASIEIDNDALVRIHATPAPEQAA